MNVLLSVLAAVSIAHDGREISGHALGGRRARLALVALALADGPLHRERLAAMIWGDDLPQSWQPALRGVIRAIRRTASALTLEHDEFIVTAPAGYGLAPGVRVDVRELAVSLDEGLRRLSQGRPELAIPLLVAASELSPGQLLPAEEFDWVNEERQTLARLRRRARETLVEAAEKAGDNRLAVRVARELVSEYPTNENAHRLLIGAHDRAGDRAGAVEAYEQCRSTLAELLGIDPSGKTVATYLLALRSATPETVGRPPTYASAFVGREAQMSRLLTAFTSSRFVTITGRGGMGKSRLALAFAVLPRDSETLWVQLGSTTKDDLVAADVARALGAAPEPDAIESLIEIIAPRGQLFLILDGCEEIADGVATLVNSLLLGCPGLMVLCTSRQALRLDGEIVLPLAAMDAETDGQPGEATILLLQRIREQGIELHEDAATFGLLARLCEKTFGIPLAIELVAAQLRDVSVRDLIDDLGESGGGTDQMRQVLDYGYNALSEEEAIVYRRLSVLDGAVELRLVRGVLSTSGILPARTARLLGELATRGFVAIDRSGPRWRYRQHDDVRRYARELLVASGEERETFAFLADTIRAMLPADARTTPAPFSAMITEALPSVRSLYVAALENRASIDAARELAFRLHRYYAASSISEGRYWLGRLTSPGAPTRWTGLATFALGYLGYWAGDATAAMVSLETSVQLLRDVEDQYAARALLFLGGISDDLDRGAEGIAFIKEAVTIAEKLGDQNLRVGATMGVASLLGERVDTEAAAFAIRAIELGRSTASADQVTAALATAAMICWQVGDFESARRFVEEAAPRLEFDQRIARVVLLSTMAGLALSDGDTAHAIELAEAGSALGAELGVERELPLVRSILARARLDAGDVPDAIRAAIDALSAAAAIAYDFPLALCLETAALVAWKIRPDDAAIATVLQSAAAIRARGDRPAPAGFAAAMEELRSRTGPALPVDARVAAALALELLSKSAGD